MFVLLSGDVEFWLEGEALTRAPGEARLRAEGREHTCRVVGDGPSRHLVVLIRAGFDGFLQETAAGDFRIPEDMASIAESAARFQLSLTGPPLGA